jgi:hypothetical protein
MLQEELLLAVLQMPAGDLGRLQAVMLAVAAAAALMA